MKHLDVLAYRERNLLLPKKIDIFGKVRPVQYEVLSGPNRGAQVNIDDPLVVKTSEGPANPHVGFQRPGKRRSGQGQRGHIILNEVLVTRGRLNED